MFKWFIERVKTANVRLAAILSSMLVAGLGLSYFYAPALATIVLACAVGVAILGYVLTKYVLERMDNMNRGDNVRRIQTELNDQESNVSQHALLDEKIKTTQATNDSNKKKQEVNESYDFSKALMSAFTSAYGFFASPSSIKKTSYQSPAEFDEAILDHKVEMDNLNSEVRIIFQAIEAFNQESRSLINIIKEEQLCSTNYNSENVVLPEDTSIRLLTELQTLRTTYPKGPYIGTPLERIKLYGEERKAHHERILSVALVLLPELDSSLNEFRALVNTRMGMRPSSR